MGRGRSSGPWSTQVTAKTCYLSPRVPCTPAFCYFSVGIWESLVGQALILSAQIWPFSLWYFLSLVVTVLQIQTQIFSAPGIHDLSFFPPFTPAYGKCFPVWLQHRFSFFVLLHNVPPLGFPKSFSFWNKEQNYFQTISVFSHATPYQRLLGEKGALQREKGRNPHFKILFGHIFYSPSIHILSCLLPAEDVYPLTTSGCCPLSLGPL